MSRNCNNCIHYEVCLFWTAIGVKRMFSKGGCGYFKDKSKIIELPCKVGDIFQKNDIRYKVTYITIYVREERTQFLMHASAVDFKEAFSICDDAFTTFWENDIGETVFPYCEEAKKALEELNGQTKNNSTEV